jgi:hypothetical protein
MSEAHEALLAEIAAGVALHYDSDGRDPDLDLLLGDQRYARGLARLAELGDLAATLELGDVISLIAQARAAGDPELAQAVWAAGRSSGARRPPPGRAQVTAPAPAQAWGRLLSFGDSL